MNRIISLVLLGLLALVIVGCAPTVTVANNTNIPVRAIVASGGVRNMLSPSPRESSTAEVTEGPYRVTVIADSEWIEYAKVLRKVLNDQLANADKLTGPQLLDLIRRLKEVAQQMAVYEQAAGSSASCSGRLTSEEGAGLAQVSQSPDGKLVVACK